MRLLRRDDHAGGRHGAVLRGLHTGGQRMIVVAILAMVAFAVVMATLDHFWGKRTANREH